MDHLLKTFMQNQASSVYLIHTFSDQGAYGMTASSLVSCSLSPALFTFNVDRQSRMWTYIKEAKWLCFQQLNESQSAYSTHFAKGKDKPDELYQGYDLAYLCEGKLPYLKDCHPSVLASVKENFKVGDHQVFVAELVELLSPVLKAPPLLYYKQAYQKLA